MKQENINSRRNFLSTLAILTSGTVMAGSPLHLINSTNANNTSLKTKWNELVKKYGATKFKNFAGVAGVGAVPVIAGQLYKAGQMVHLPNEDVLAQPTWIYWGEKREEPNDVVVTFFESHYPYARKKNINRFEMLALEQLPSENNLLRVICNKQQNQANNRLEIKTRIAKKKTTQHINLVANNALVFNKQFFYNV